MKGNRERKRSLTEGKEPLRLLALTDGLFATVLTLLVLDLKIPSGLDAAGGNVMAFVQEIGPHLFSYVLTFLVAGSYWLAHHRDFDHLGHYNRGLLSYNLLFLFFIGLFPFTTATLSLRTSTSSDFAFYWAIYAANIILAGVMLELTWLYAVSHGLVTTETTPHAGRSIALIQLVTPFVFLISIVAEFLFPRAFLGPYTLLLIPVALWGVGRLTARSDPERLAQPVSWSEVLWRAGMILPWLLIIGLAVWATSR